MSIKDLIKSAFEKDATSFEETFANIMAEKQEAAIAAKYDSMFGEELEEAKEDEDEDEEMEDEDDEEEDDEDEDED